jgi:hypothetical protein
LKILTENIPIEISESTSILTTGTKIKIKEYEFEVVPDPAFKDIFQVAKKLGFNGQHWYQEQVKAENQFIDVLKYFLLSYETGELVVRGASQKATLFLDKGDLCGVVCGSVMGEKALQRVLLWQQVQWSWNPLKEVDSLDSSINMDFFKVKKFYKDSIHLWQKIQDLAPPNILKMKVDPTAFNSRQKWNYSEIQVVAAIAEFNQVVDVLNRCPLNDTDIVEKMVHFRKEGLIQIER